jgi:hypothetical protein
MDGIVVHILAMPPNTKPVNHRLTADTKTVGTYSCISYFGFHFPRFHQPSSETSSFQVVVVYSGDQVESQSEPSASVPAAVGNNPEAFQRADHMLVQDSLAGNLAVEALVLFCQRMLLAPLFRVTAHGMPLRNPETSRVGCRRHGGMNP